MKHGWEVRIDPRSEVENPANVLRDVADELDKGLVQACQDGIERVCITAGAECRIVRTREDAVRQPATGDLFETFKNLLFGAAPSMMRESPGYGGTFSQPDYDPDEAAIRSVAAELVSEVERHIAQVVVPQSLEEPAKPIVVTVSGGVADVALDTIPAGMTVEVRDYDNGAGYDPDAEGAETPAEAGLEQDSEGDWYTCFEYCFDDRPVSYPKSKCDNCHQTWCDTELVNPIPDLDERMDEDGPEPSGECPNCGALCYPIPEGE